MTVEAVPLGGNRGGFDGAHLPVGDPRPIIPRTVLDAGRTFLGDPGLVHGIVRVQSLHMPPAAAGEYSLQIISDGNPTEQQAQMNAIARAKMLVVGCMDKRQAEALYLKAQTLRYAPEDIVMLTVGGGIIQTEHSDRERALGTMIDYVVDNASGLETIVLSAHTSDPEHDGSSPCGGVTFLNNGKPIATTLTHREEDRLVDAYQLPDRSLQQLELAATAEAASRHAADILAKHRDRLGLGSLVWVVVPNDETHGIRQIFTERPDGSRKKLEELAPWTVRK
ncbi:MAG: hypothetical protein ACREGI_02980 [Candidatus Levyibacteriota bacterium]